MSVVVGFVVTPEGRAALDQGIVEARLRSTRLVVVHSSPGGSSETAEAVSTNREELERLERELATMGVDYEVRDLARGHTPAVDLVSVATETGAHLIVIGLRRRSPVGKLLLGSDAQQILLQADCPVLAVKAGPAHTGPGHTGPAHTGPAHTGPAQAGSA